MALITDLPTNASPTSSDFLVTDNGVTTSKSTLADVRAGMNIMVLATREAISNAKTYTIPNSSRHLILVEGAISGRHGMYMVTASTSGTVAISKIVDGSSLSVTTGTNSLSIDPGGGAVYVVDFVISGTSII